MTQACSLPEAASRPTYSAGAERLGDTPRSRPVGANAAVLLDARQRVGLVVELAHFRLSLEHHLVVDDLLVDGADAGPVTEVVHDGPVALIGRRLVVNRVDLELPGKLQLGSLEFRLALQDVAEVIAGADFHHAVRQRALGADLVAAIVVHPARVVPHHRDGDGEFIVGLHAGGVVLPEVAEDGHRLGRVVGLRSMAVKSVLIPGLPFRNSKRRGVRRGLPLSRAVSPRSRRRMPCGRALFSLGNDFSLKPPGPLTVSMRS